MKKPTTTTLNWLALQAGKCGQVMCAEHMYDIERATTSDSMILNSLALPVIFVRLLTLTWFMEFLAKSHNHMKTKCYLIIWTPLLTVCLCIYLRRRRISFFLSFLTAYIYIANEAINLISSWQEKFCHFNSSFRRRGGGAIYEAKTAMHTIQVELSSFVIRVFIWYSHVDTFSLHMLKSCYSMPLALLTSNNKTLTNQTKSLLTKNLILDNANWNE